MAVNTVLLDFSVDPNLPKNEETVLQLIENLESILRNYFNGLKLISSVQLDKDLIRFYTSELGATIYWRFHSNGLLTINIDFIKKENEEPQLSYEHMRELEQHISKSLVEIKRSRTFIPIKRCTFINYFPTSDDRLLEYDIDKLIFEEVTPFQKIQIVHSKSLGNMLVLDDLQNISEADLIYTETLMARGKENYKNKEIVILGGGDGALLFELLKEGPKEVVMLEIDEVVMKACAKHMRSICGDVLDNLNGSNYKIIVGNCMKTLRDYITEGRKFDYVFGDLTDVPISENLTGQVWTFINQVLQLSFGILKPDGKYMTHLTGTSSPASITMYESLLTKIEPAVKFTTSKAFVPSFLEDWVFCQVTFDKNTVQ